MRNSAVSSKIHWTHDQDRLSAWAPAGRKISPPDRIQTVRPLGQRLEQPQMAVARTRRRIRVEASEISHDKRPFEKGAQA